MSNSRKNVQFTSLDTSEVRQDVLVALRPFEVLRLGAMTY